MRRVKISTKSNYERLSRMILRLIRRLREINVWRILG